MLDHFLIHYNSFNQFFRSISLVSVAICADASIFCNKRNTRLISDVDIFIQHRSVVVETGTVCY